LFRSWVVRVLVSILVYGLSVLPSALGTAAPELKFLASGRQQGQGRRFLSLAARLRGVFAAKPRSLARPGLTPSPITQPTQPLVKRTTLAWWFALR
jgi:hypothetical protein